MTRNEASQEIQWYERRWAGMKRRIKELEDERDRLREALENLTTICEKNHRIAYIGWAWDKYEFAFDPKHDNPVKTARAALQEDNDES